MNMPIEQNATTEAAVGELEHLPNPPLPANEGGILQAAAGHDFITESTSSASPLTAQASRRSGSHKVSAIYASQAEAESVRQHLIQGGIAADEVVILHESSPPFVEEGSDEVLKDVLVDGAIGTAVGAGVGAVGTAILWASSITLFVASPVVAPLMMLGWFASVGGLVGAATGAAETGAPEAGTPRKEGRLSELVMDAIKSGNVVLIAHTYDQTERESAKSIIGNSLKGRDEVVSESD